jgi:hypothetical protein
VSVELVDRLVDLADDVEPTLNRPEYVNGGAFVRPPEAARVAT